MMKISTFWVNVTLALINAALAVNACVKPPVYPAEPVIAFKGMSKTLISQRGLGKDTLAITFDFTNGDRDLNFMSDKGSIILTDTRDNFENSRYRIGSLDLQGGGNGISGEVTFLIANDVICCIYPFDSGIVPCDIANAPQSLDTMSFKIRIKDRAGNISNTIETPPFYLQCKQ
jgi:hypothetical protein